VAAAVALEHPVVGGAELQQTLIATELARRGFPVSMISHDYGQEEGVVVDGVRVHRMYAPNAGIRIVRFVHPRLTSLWSALKRADADIYYQRTAACATGFLAAFCRANGKKSVFAGASDVDFMPGQESITFARDRWIFAYGVRNVDAIFAQNPCQQENALRHYGRDSVLIPNCYRAPEGARADPRGYVLWVANVRSQKRPQYLIELARRLPQHRFVMVGGSDSDRRSLEYADAIRAQAAQLPNVEVNKFIPFHEAEKLFDGARVVLNTSTYEGFPNTFLQAWARGAPIVSFVDTGSRHRGKPVYEMARDMDHATRQLDRLMTDDVAWHAASARVLEHFRERHSVDSVVDLYEREFQRLAGPAALPRAA
jgi:glycosyltransferase involved in cell wall biosynthesis